MNAWFADSSYWIVFLNKEDEQHHRALHLSQTLSGFFITTHWVIAELLDGCSNRPSRSRALELVRAIQQQEEVTIVPASDELFTRGIELYAQRPDKEWSFTDCVSFLVMNDFDLVEALTSDHHFEQAGFVALLKQEIS